MMIKVSREVNLMEVGKNGVDMAAGAEGRALFPRLHVKETKISGPRAPPRNKMALYEQLSIPSHRYVASAARQNPPTLLNQSVTCDTRLVYAPYYVTPNTYSHVNFHGQFIAHNVTSGDNNSLNEVGKSDPGSIRTREASDATTSNSHASKAPSSRNGIVSSGPVAGDTCHQSCGLSKSSRTNDAAAGSLHNREDSSSPAGGVALDSMRKTQSPVGPPSQRQECSMKLDYITDSGGKKAELLKNPLPGLKSNGQCSEAMSLDESSNEGVEEDSRVDTEDNYRCKNSCSSESIVSSKGIDHCSSKQNCQTAGSGHAPHNVQEDTSLCAESYHKGEKLSKDSENATDSCPWRDASVKRQHTVQIHIGHPNRTNSGSLAAAEGENSDHNSDSSMVDSIHIFEITPQSVIEAIGQKEFWKVRRAILRQQKIFSTQVFELHRLVKVQKLIAMSPNLLIDDAVFENIPISASEEQRVPCIEPENFRKTASMDGTPNTESDMSKGKADKKELKNQSPLPSRASVVSHVSQSGEVRSNVHACSSPLATAVPGLASAWSYPIFPQNYYGAVSHQGGYVGYNPYAFNQMGGPGIVMGIPCGLEGTLMNQPSVNVSPNQFTGSAEFQFHGMGHFPSPPFNGTCYSMSPSLGKFPHSTGSAVGAGSQKEMSAASNGHESVARESKHSAVYTSEKTSSASHFHEYISNIASRPAKQPATQTHTNNMKLHGDSTPAHSISEQKQSSNPQGNERCTAMRWSRSSNSYHGHNLREPDGRSITRASIDLENQALALFPMSSSVSGASESAKENSAPEQRVRVIKAVPRAAVAASETTADILLSLQRERRQ